MSARFMQAAVTISLLLAVAAIGAVPAGAAEALATDTSAPGFAVGSVAQPTLFSSSRNAECDASVAKLGSAVDEGVVSFSADALVDCDSYTVTVRNEGGANTGTARVGETDSCEPGSWEFSPTAYEYEWVRGPLKNFEAERTVVATTQSYTVAASDEGDTLTCVVKAKNAYGTVAASTPVPLRVAPVSSGLAQLALAQSAGKFAAPSVVASSGTGTVAVGETVSCSSPGEWEVEDQPKEGQLWKHQQLLIDGATLLENDKPTASTTVTAADAGKTIQCAVFANFGVASSDHGEQGVFAVSANRIVVSPTAGEPPQLDGGLSSFADAPAASGVAVTVKDALPAGVTPVAISGAFALHDERGEVEAQPLGCSFADLFCRLPIALPADGMLAMRVYVTTSKGEGETITANQALVSGGSAVSRSTAQEPEGKVVPTPVSAGEPLFAIQDFSFQAFGSDGAPDVQAGDHPNAVTVAFQLPTVVPRETSPAAAELKDVRVDLPLGFIGDPLVSARCPSYEIHKPGSAAESDCPPDTQVGALGFTESISKGMTGDEELPIYNVAPQEGYPAEFAALFAGREVTMFANVIPAPAGQGGYDLQVTVPGIPLVSIINGATVTFFGDPAQRSGSGAGQAFLTNPVACGTDPVARIEADSWQEPEGYVSAEAPLYAESETLTGCSFLQFNPALEAKVESSSADTPTGYEVKLTVPQAPNFFPALATPELKDTTVALPEDLTVSPSAANGLVACPASGAEGINIGEEAIDGAGHEDGQEHLVPGKCPLASRIGTLQIKTPLLEQPLSGYVYVAQPECDPCEAGDAEAGKTFGLYLEAEGSGVIVKLAGRVKANPQTGRLTAVFEDNPQLPFGELTLKLTNGARAPLVTPQSCGSYTTTSTLLSWSGASAQSLSPLAIGGCPGGGTPFAPAFSAGSTTTQAGSYTNLTLTFSRKDGEQDLGGIVTHMPAGLLGEIARVTQCGEAEANAGTCPASSQIGTTTVAAGPGSEPYWLHGQVYLTGPYKGDPFGLAIVVPTTAGPFTLAGNTGKGSEVVRASIAVDPYTAALTITSDPLPQVVDGVQIRLQTVNVEVNRPDFMLNPTNCEQQSIAASIAAAGGATSSASSPFAASDCASLAFKPGFEAETHAAHSRKDGDVLNVDIASGSGQANIAKVHVTLPKDLAARDATLELACSEAQFAANPSDCPEGSFVGTATVHTPVLAKDLTGPAIFVSHGHAAFPDLDLVLQGEGITVIQEGETFISKSGYTSNTFAAVPDVPVSSIELSLPEGSKSALAGEGNLCTKAQDMPTTITGQNGAVLEQTTKIKVSGCKTSKSTVKINKAETKRKGDTLVVAFTTSAKGRIAITGKGLKTIKRTLSAGAHRTKVPLTKAGKRLHGKTSVKVTLAVGKQKVTKSLRVSL